MADGTKLDVTAGLARVQTGLARARDEADFVRAVADALAPLGPQFIDLGYVYVDDAGRPSGLEVMRSWANGEVLAEAPYYGVRVDIGGESMAWARLESTSEPVMWPRISDNPGLDAGERGIGRAVASALILPLYSERHGAWQGMVGAYWAEPHEFAAHEPDLYRALARMLAESIGGERTLRALRDSLAANERLLAETRASLAETHAQRVMLGVLLDNLPLGVTVLHGQTGARELQNRVCRELLDAHEPGKPGVTEVYMPGASEPLPMDQRPIAHTLRHGETARRELELTRDGGERRLFDITTAPLRYPDDPVIRVICLFHDITDQRRGEAERRVAQEELLRVQAAALAERSTPLIPIHDDVLVMPIIGTIDGERGRQILETLVHLNGAARVRAALVDITGVQSLDTFAANLLINAARALRLRGVEPILTGLRPVVASLLVGLGVDLSGVTVCGTLQDGVALATRVRGRGVV